MNKLSLIRGRFSTCQHIQQLLVRKDLLYQLFHYLLIFAFFRCGQMIYHNGIVFVGDKEFPTKIYPWDYDLDIRLWWSLCHLFSKNFFLSKSSWEFLINSLSEPVAKFCFYWNMVKVSLFFQYKELLIWDTF